AKTFSVGTVMIQKVSCSIGLAYYPKDGAEFETLYKAADQAMYRSKKGGKARVSV
ncbi:MAG: diguanylate cyclase, partial [Blautia sp.]|nr:diguanylate cyclase [Blautia sp.]